MKYYSYNNENSKIEEKDIKDEFFRFIEKKSFNKQNEINIVLISMAVLKKNSAFFKEYYEYFKDTFNPTIIIGTEDIMGTYLPRKKVSQNSDKKIELTDKEKTKIERKGKIYSYLNIDRRFRFFDSSIWNYYVPSLYFDEAFDFAIKEIENNYKLKLYNCNVAKEYHELNIRQMKNSYLSNVGEGHSEAIAPFKFHSESLFDKLASEVKDKINKLGEKRLNWEFLLIDDFANKSLSGTINKNEDETQSNSSETVKYSKKYIIEKILKRDNFIEDKNCSIKIEAVSSAKPFIDVKIKERIYDIILLDYLLGTKENQDNNEREYGHEIIVKINEYIEQKEDIKRGPLGVFWIFPVSVFSGPILDRLREKGISHISEYWYISRGADPINNPHLFRYNLYMFMLLQLELAHYSAEHIKEFFLENPISLIDKEENDRVTKWAKAVLGSFLHKFGKKEILEIDKKHKSKFAKSMLELYPKIKDFQIYDHVKELLYQLAYGTSQDSARMIVNFDYIKSHEVFSKNNKKLEKIFKEIAKYIYDKG